MRRIQTAVLERTPRSLLGKLARLFPLILCVISCSLGISWTETPATFVRIKGGRFLMGSPPSEMDRRDSETLHEVQLRDFWLASREVTFAEFDLFTDDTGQPRFSDYGLGRGSRPALKVTWIDAIEYCNWRSKREGLKPCYTLEGMDARWEESADGYRLPTEAEWEYACRAGTTTAYTFGETIGPDLVNYCHPFPMPPPADGGPRRRTQPVGSYPSNAWGLFDMHGNVWEWCWDWMESYPSGFQSDPQGPPAGDARVLRGGSCDTTAAWVRSAKRLYAYPGYAIKDFGFRLARSAR